MDGYICIIYIYILHSVGSDGLCINARIPAQVGG